ncbi:MAG: hypothetical protein IJ466_07420 [Clostridia bacterium]|nr:hypothetical protein [Clostridia bacterium]
MKYEAEYMPDTGELADVVHILKDGRAVEVDAPDDTEDPVDEEGEEPHVEYD